jgi:hypothetical protein
MVEPVNLNRFRKEKARVEKQTRADENAVKFGRTKSEKSREKALSELDAKRLSAHRREDEPKA